MKDGQAVWVQGKKAVVSHTDANGNIWVQFENDLNVAYEYEPHRVCVRSIHRSDRAEKGARLNFID